MRAKLSPLKAIASALAFLARDRAVIAAAQIAPVGADAGTVPAVGDEVLAVAAAVARVGGCLGG